LKDLQRISPDSQSADTWLLNEGIVKADVYLGNNLWFHSNNAVLTRTGFEHRLNPRTGIIDNDPRVWQLYLTIEEKFFDDYVFHCKDEIVSIVSIDKAGDYRTVFLDTFSVHTERSNRSSYYTVTFEWYDIAAYNEEELFPDTYDLFSRLGDL